MACKSLQAMQVVNCLSCGKIFDCRNVTSDVLRFLDAGGKCTFCGAKVALSYNERSQENVPHQASPAGQRGAAGKAGGVSSSNTHSTAAAAAVDYGASVRQSKADQEAVELKNRLVEYDRNAAKRTTVIDDQSDYFEIDTNAWLTGAAVWLSAWNTISLAVHV